jgi:hypothetical protein
MRSSKTCSEQNQYPLWHTVYDIIGSFTMGYSMDIPVGPVQDSFLGNR